MAPSLAERLPKIHLHCHLEGAVRAETFVDLAARRGVPLHYRSADRADAQDPYRFGDLQEFLYTFAAVSRSLAEPDDYGRVAREFVEDALAQNVVYGELFVSPPVWTFFNPGLDVRAAMEAIVSELRRARPRASFVLLPDLTRNFGAERALETARAVAGMTSLDIVGISLGGDEATYPAALFADAFDYARACGLHRVAHAGEGAGAQSVRDAIELLGAERIGHGIRALDDPPTLELLASRRIALEVCPTSNERTGVATGERPHPYVDLDHAGCVVTIDADDPAIFQTSIEREYALVERVAGAPALERYVRNAIDASFAAASEKAALQALVSRAVAEISTGSRK